MDWYYAVGGERFGPFDQEVFDQLVSQGRITGVTLVWHDGLADWVQYQFLAAPTPRDQGDMAPVLVQCSQCLRQAAGDDMVQYQGHWICAECKDTFYQRVREGSFSPQDPAGTRQHRFAGFWIRVVAAILDGLILFAVNAVLGFLFLGIISSANDPGTVIGMQLFMNLVQLAIGISYVTCFLGKYGATPGKMACGLKVIVSDGRPISYWRAFGRYWAVVLSFLIPYISIVITVGITVGVMLTGSDGPGRNDLDSMLIVGFMLAAVVGLLMSFPFYMAGLTRQKCALHDFICNTRVIRAR